ncbi:MAG: HlyD family type I secretion periplasmic adaptor subunit [Pseudomonadota bacterium]
MNQNAEPQRAWNTGRPLFLGFVALLVLVGGVGTWSAISNISGAIISSGMIAVEGNRQAVQHVDGGIVGEILVEEGDFVEAGEVLVRFDNLLLSSEMAIITNQLHEIMARKARLIAERDGSEGVTFPSEILNAATVYPAVMELVQGHERLFRARLETRDKQATQLRERIVQIERQIEGTDAQIVAMAEQQRLIAQELEGQRTLLASGLTQQSRVLSLEREAARQNGVLGELQARVAQFRAQISETEIEILRLTDGLREEAITTLRDLEYREIELRERMISTRETLERLEVRAPSTGIIYARAVNTPRAVVRPADILMYVVPQGQPLVISSRIETIHVDQVNIGQTATLRLPAFDQRTTPELEGIVTKISPDAFTDETTGMSYYTAELLPLEGEIEKLGDLVLLPGMPVEAFIRTGDRTPLNYLVKPLSDYFTKAFRET